MGTTQRKSKVWPIILISFLSVVVFIVFPIILRIFVVEGYRIPSEGMKPTLLIGDCFLVNKFTHAAKNPGRGDIIVFIYPEDTSRRFIQKVVGLPGDVVEIREKQLYINNEPVEEEYIIHIDENVYTREQSPRDNFGPVTVPSDSYFMLGDNRDSSLDSRFWGFLGKDKVIGKAWVFYWSYDKENGQVRWERIGKSVH